MKLMLACNGWWDVPLVTHDGMARGEIDVVFVVSEGEHRRQKISPQAGGVSWQREGPVTVRSVGGRFRANKVKVKGYKACGSLTLRTSTNMMLAAFQE